MDGSKTYNIPPETAYPPPSYTESTLNPNTGYYPNQGVSGSLPQFGVQNPQGVQTTVTALSTVYVTQVPLNPPVPDYLGYSIFTMLCCCLPLGIAGLIYSISVSMKGILLLLFNILYSVFRTTFCINPLWWKNGNKFNKPVTTIHLLTA